MKVGKLHKRIITALFFSLFTMTGCDAKADNHRVYKLSVISDVETTLSFSKEIAIRGRPVHLTVLYESVRGKPIASIHRSHSPRFIENMVKKTSAVMDSFLRERGITISDCRGYKYNLIITVVSKDVLQDDNRFRGFYKMKYGVEKLMGHTLYGFYDPTLEVPNNSSILVTHVGSRMNEEVLSHELAHYWWDRLCAVREFSGTSEGFAQAFDQYYMRSR